ncbi:hypothetical protein CapIbe_012708 [Capra ibex]
MVSRPTFSSPLCPPEFTLGGTGRSLEGVKDGLKGKACPPVVGGLLRLEDGHSGRFPLDSGSPARLQVRSDLPCTAL